MHAGKRSTRQRNFPRSLTSIVNQSIHSNILGSSDFAWNLNLVYTCSKSFVEK